MKYRRTYYVQLDSISACLREHTNVIAIQLVKTGIPQVYAVITESLYTEAEMHMQVLRTQLECDEYLTEEEKAAMEFSIDCIKTLKDMGVIK